MTYRLDDVAYIIEIFEDFLEAKGIDIPNDEKAEDEDASLIYGTDFGMLSDHIEDVLIGLGLQREV